MRLGLRREPGKSVTSLSRDARELLFLALAFVTGFLGSLAVCAWLLIRFGWKEMPWWEIPPTLLQMLLASVSVGVMVCGAVLWLSLKWRSLTGTHRCFVCDRKQRTPGFCEDCIRGPDHGA